MRLKSDVLTTTNDGLMSEKAHLTSELKETRDLYKTYEARCSSTVDDLNKVQAEFQTLKRNMISYDEQTRLREEKIASLKNELQDQREKYSELDMAYNSLKIDQTKIKEQLDTANKDLTDTVNKLHSTNKVRHETEIKLGEEFEKSAGLQDIVKSKDDQLNKKQGEIEELDKRILEMERQNEALDIKK